jgi:hypothetical protein
MQVILLVISGGPRNRARLGPKQTLPMMIHCSMLLFIMIHCSSSVLWADTQDRGPGPGSAPVSDYTPESVMLKGGKMLLVCNG